jgi:hypothetical protein
MIAPIATTALLGVAVAFVAAPALATNSTPASRDAVILAPLNSLSSYNNHWTVAAPVVQAEGYATEYMIDHWLDDNASTTVEGFGDALLGGPGAVLIRSWGDPGVVLVEAYHTAYWEVAYTRYLYVASGPPWGGKVVFVSTSSFCGIGFKREGIELIGDRRAIVHVASAYSATVVPPWAAWACFLSYEGNPAPNTIRDEIDAVWARLAGDEGKALRALDAAIEGTQLASSGDERMVLAPAVLSVQPAAGAAVDCGSPGRIEFDARMDTSVAAHETIAISGPLNLRDVAWANDHAITFTCGPVEFDPATITLDAGLLVGAGGAGLALDGNTDPAGSDGLGPAGDDYQWTVDAACAEDEPAAWIAGARWRGGSIEWVSAREESTLAYRLAGATSLQTGDWTPASETIAARGGGARHSLRPSSAHAFYRIEELESRGGVTRWLSYAALPAAPGREREPARGRDLGPACMLASTAGRPLPAGDLSANELALVYPSALDATGALSAYAAEKDAQGWNVSVFPLSPGSTSYDQVRALVSLLKEGDAITLFGAVRDGNGPGTTMPAPWEPDTFSTYFDFSVFSETILTLWEYEYDPQNPARVGPWVGYVPIESAAEAWAFTNKMAAYESGAAYQESWDDFASWGFDVQYGGNQQGPVVAGIEAATALVPASWERSAIWGSQPPPGWGWSEMASANLNAGQGVVLGMATASSSENPTYWLNAGAGYFDPWTDLVANDIFALFLPLSCSANQIDAVAPDDLPVVVHDLMVVPQRGIIASIGPTRGFYQRYYAEYAKTWWELYATGDHRFAGELHRAVRNRLLDENPEDAVMPLFCRMMILAGDPTTALPGIPAGATSVAHANANGGNLWLGQPTPNPFNPAVRIALRLARAAEVRCRVLDVAGRQVARPLDASLPAGDHFVSWDGRDQAGGRAASGVYLFELESLDTRVTRRAVLLR